MICRKLLHGLLAFFLIFGVGIPSLAVSAEGRDQGSREDGAGGSDIPLPLLRISVENTTDHVHTRAVKRFADDLAVSARGRLQVRLYDNARLYRDTRVLSALAADQVEMAVPGTWHFDRYVPHVGIFLLPAFYGRKTQDIHAVSDGAVGKRVVADIQENLPVFVIGRWLDLGHAHVYSTRPIRKREDMAGMNIRVAGGLGNIMRIEALGARGVAIPWPDLTARLSQGGIDGVLTSHETIRSAGLWEYGLKYIFEDGQYFPQYIPLVNLKFWRRLPQDLRETILECWERHVDTARREAAVSQQEARKVLEEHGMIPYTPSDALLESHRALLMEKQDAMVNALKIDPALYAKALAVLDELNRQRKVPETAVGPQGTALQTLDR